MDDLPVPLSPSSTSDSRSRGSTSSSRIPRTPRIVMLAICPTGSLREQRLDGRDVLHATLPQQDAQTVPRALIQLLLQKLERPLEYFQRRFRVGAVVGLAHVVLLVSMGPSSGR